MQFTNGNINQYSNLSQFESLKDFNNNIEQWMVDLKSKFTKSELIALKRLIRYSANVAGVCNAKIQTIVSATHQKNELGGISRSTFERMLRKAKELGLLVVYNTTKKNGYKAHNIYVFNRYPSQVEETKKKKVSLKDRVVSILKSKEVSKNEKIDVSNKTINLFKTSKQKDINKRYNKRYVPTKFYHLASCYFHEQETIGELWKIIQISNYHTKYERHIMLDLACDALHDLIAHIKQNTVKKSIYALFWGIVQNKLDELYFNDLYELEFAL